MSNHLIHLVLQHVYVWTLPSVTIAAIRGGFWQEGDGAKYLCRPGARRGRSLPSSPFGRVGSFARRSCFERGRYTADRTRCQRTERNDFISGIAQSVKTATVDVVCALPNATDNRRENMLPLRLSDWEFIQVVGVGPCLTIVSEVFASSLTNIIRRKLQQLICKGNEWTIDLLHEFKRPTDLDWQANLKM